MLRMSREQALIELGLKSDAKPAQIKAAYLKLVLETHPDKKEKKQDPDSKFQAISEAFKILKEKPAMIEMDPSVSTPEKEHIHFKINDPESTKEAHLFFKEFHSFIADNSQNAEAKKAYVIKHKDKIQEAITILNSIDYLITFLDTNNYELLTLLDPTWFKQWSVFNKHPAGLSRFLTKLDPENWNPFFNDHLGGIWFKEFCIQNFCAVLNSLPTKHQHTKSNETTVETLLNHLGQPWFRGSWYNDYQFATALGSLSSTERYHTFLNFIDGKDKWLRTIIDGKDLGIILDALSSEVKVTPNDPNSRSRSIVSHWSDILRYIDLKRLINHPGELNALLTHLGNDSFPFTGKQDQAQKYHKLSTNNIVLFLETYLPEQLTKKNYTNLNQLIDLLDITCEVRTTHIPHDLIKSLGIISAFNKKEIYQILFENTDEKKSLNLTEVLSSISLHKDKPYYRALLLAAVKGYYYQCMHRGEDGSIIKAAEALINSILADEPIDKKKHPKITQGELGKISTLYTEERTPSRSAMNYIRNLLSAVKNQLLLLKSSQKPLLIDHQPNGQLLIENKFLPTGSTTTILSATLVPSAPSNDKVINKPSLQWPELKRIFKEQPNLTLEEKNNYFIQLDKTSLHDKQSSGYLTAFYNLFVPHPPEYIKEMNDIRQQAFEQLEKTIEIITDNKITLSPEQKTAIITLLKNAHNMAIFKDHRKNHWYEGAFGRTATIQKIEALLTLHGEPAPSFINQMRSGLRMK